MYPFRLDSLLFILLYNVSVRVDTDRNRERKLPRVDGFVGWSSLCSTGNLSVLLPVCSCHGIPSPNVLQFFIQFCNICPCSNKEFHSPLIGFRIFRHILIWVVGISAIYASRPVGVKRVRNVAGTRGTEQNTSRMLF